jgi:hypothetical protein
MNGMKIPTFNRSLTYTTDVFETSHMQVYIALFLSKPQLYSSVLTLPSYAKQEKFFELFRKFVCKYYTFDVNDPRDIELMMYFGSLQVDKSGCANICGGGGGRSSSGKKYLLDNYKSGQEFTKKSIVYLGDKYRIRIDGTSDEREFIGHKQIWMEPSPDLLKKNGMEWVVEQSYDDETFASEFGMLLDKSLVPLQIRNKAIQKWKKWKSEKYGVPRVSADKVDDEEKDEKKLVFSGKYKEDKEEKETTLVIDADLQKMLDEEDW